jgi:hypothetical protein
MSVETATYISQLNNAYPAATDGLKEGDDHIRLIKSVLQNTFPAVSGAVTKSHTQINTAVDQAAAALPATGGTMTGPLALAANASSALQAVPKQQLDSSIATAIASINSVPSGMIAMWAGAATAIPSGWFLCNGLNGTPDLRDRFVVGAGNSYAVGATGGSKDAVVVSHSHGITIATSGSHYHTQRVDGVDWDTSGRTGYTYASGTQWTDGIRDSTAYTANAGDHTHSATITTEGVSGTDKNLPPYYALCFIMKS